MILHRDEIMASPARALSDFDLFTSSGRLEYQANRFLADFLVSDEAVLGVTSNENADFYNTAGELYLPPPLLAFKLHSMVHRGFPVKNPVDLQSDFLRF